MCKFNCSSRAHCASLIRLQCLNIASVLPGKVYGGAYNLSGYAAQSDSYYSNQEKEVKPACFVLPQSSQDVSFAIRALTSPIARDLGTGSGQASSAEFEEILEPKRKSWSGWSFLSSFGKSRVSGPRGSRATVSPGKNAAKAQSSQLDDGTCKFAIRSGG